MADKKPLVNSAGNAVEIATGDTIPIANGGTGAATANAALNALLPSQTGNSGEFLTTDGTNASWAAPSLGSSFVGKTIAVYKTGNQSVTSSTTLVDCTDLSFSIAANEVWIGSFLPIVMAGASGGVKWAFTAPSGCSVTVRAQGGSSFATSIIDGNGLTGNGVSQIHSTASKYELTMIITNSSTAGTVQFQFAQNTSNGTATTVSKNSVLILSRTA